MNTNNFIVSDKQMNLDMKMAVFDLWATRVHVIMLCKQKIIRKSAAAVILRSLMKLEVACREGKFSIDPDLGLHLTIEAEVIKAAGEDGYFMHTGRSRNDEVMTSELLYLKEKLLTLAGKLFSFLDLILEKSSEHITTVMPGYTHMQPAKPTTFGQWCLSYFDMLNKVFDTFIYVIDKYDQCPLGAGESYGTSWPLDREISAKMLGFAGVWELPQAAITSRGLVQLAYMGGLRDLGIILGKIAADLLLFNTFEFGYIKLNGNVAGQMNPVTGSSIMPQKRNPDVLELLRSYSSQMIGLDFTVANILSGLPMGYNRDGRDVKEYMEMGLDKTAAALDAFYTVMNNLGVNKDKMRDSVVNNYSLSADLADFLAQKTGLAYRKIYKAVGSLVKKKITLQIPLKTLTVKELVLESMKWNLNLGSITEDDLKKALDPGNAVFRRKNIGGSNPAVMIKMILERKKQMAGLKKGLKRHWQIISEAKSLTGKEMELII